MIARTATIALLAAAALGAAACGNDDDSVATAPPATTPATTAPATTPATTAPRATRRSISKELDVKPEIPKPTGTPPSKLVVKDIVEGDGKRAKAGDRVTVQYVGVSYSTGEQFDATWDSGKPFTFQLGAGMVIPGWDEGVAGMRVGGRRELVIPPDLAYGAEGRPGIAPNETLVFVIDLVKRG